MNKPTKKTIIKILIYFLIQLPIALYCINRKFPEKEIPYITAQNIKNGSSIIYDREKNDVGEITVYKDNEKLMCSIQGDEIKGISILDKEYILKRIEHTNLEFELKKLNNEEFYFCDTGDTGIFITKIRRDSYSDRKSGV